MKIYIAAPLFNDLEKARNIEIKNYLKNLGFDTYLPQEDGTIAFNRIEAGEDRAAIRKLVFENDSTAIKNCDIMLCILDGRVPDEGVCIELGIAYALKKICIGYKTDHRSLDKYGDNLMIEECLEKVVHSHQELKEYLKKR